MKSFQRHAKEPVILCGDLNSRPHGVAHSYLTHGHINAKLVAPWYGHLSVNPDEETIMVEPEENGENSDDEDDPGNVESLTNDVSDLHLSSNHGKSMMSTAVAGASAAESPPRMRYMLDASLNKLCRWLRILGQDVALETDEEEKLRTGKQAEMIIFDRCREEQRTLVTTSPRLMERRDCPASAYCVSPPFLSSVQKLEVAMVHMLLTHGVVLEPASFLSRCVVCNGKIVEVDEDEEKRRILIDYEAPPDLINGGMAVYECDGCKQGTVGLLVLFVCFFYGAPLPRRILTEIV